jgi:hypothetical protein
MCKLLPPGKNDRLYSHLHRGWRCLYYKGAIHTSPCVLSIRTLSRYFCLEPFARILIELLTLMLIIQLDSTGSPLWAKTFGGTTLDQATKVACDATYVYSISEND